MKNIYIFLLFIIFPSVTFSQMKKEKTEYLSSFENYKTNVCVRQEMKVSGSKLENDGNFIVIGRIKDNLLVKGEYKDGYRVSTWEYYTENKDLIKKNIYSNKGNQFIEILYYEGKRVKKTEGRKIINKESGTEIMEGKWTYYYDNSKKKLVENYKNGKLSGDKIYFDEYGEVIKQETYINGNLNEKRGKFLFLEDRLESEFNKAKSFYQKDEGIIYKSEIKPLERSFKDNKTQFKKKKPINNTQNRYDILKKILEKISNINDNHRKIGNITKEITESYNILEASYKVSFKNIYDEQIKSFEKNEIKEYKNSPNVTDKILAGEKLLDVFDNYLEIYDSLLIIDKNIKDMFPKLERQYEDYPSILKGEIKDLDNEINNYYKINLIFEKKITGKIILTKINKLKRTYENFEQADESIKTDFPIIQANFKENYKAIYKEEINELDKKIEIYKKINIVTNKIFASESIIDEIKAYSKYFEELQELDVRISEKKTEMETTYESTFPNIYKGEIKDIKNQIPEYEKLKFCNERIKQTNVILTQISYIIDIFPELDKQKKELEDYFNLTRERYVDDFPYITKEEISPIEGDLKDWRKISYTKEKVTKGNEIKTNLEKLNEKYPILQEQKEEIEAEVISVETMFKEEFKNVYKYEIKPVLTLRDEWKKIGNSTTKLTNGVIILQKIESIKNNYDELKDHKKTIGENYLAVEVDYKNTFPEIYKVEIKKLKEDKKEWEDKGNIIEKLEKGKGLIKDLEDLEDRFKKLEQQDITIKAENEKMKSQFTKTFPSIYKNELARIELKVNSWIAESSSKIKIESGDKLIEELEEKNNSFDELIKQKDKIETDYENVKNIYKQMFKPIYKEEIANIKLDSYYEAGYIETKLKNGAKVQVELDTFDVRFNRLTDQEELIVSTKYPKLEDNFKLKFKVIYKTEVKGIQKEIKNYQKNGKSRQREIAGVAIIKKIDKLNSRAKEMSELHGNINIEYTKFLTRYKKKKLCKHIYKKGVIMYKIRTKNYQKEGYLDKKIEKARELIEMLQRLNTLENSNEKNLNIRLKKSKEQNLIEKYIKDATPNYKPNF